MKVIFLPPENIYEGTPLEIIIEGGGKSTRAMIKGWGDIPLNCGISACKGHFHIPQEGSHEIVVENGGKALWKQSLLVHKAQFLNMGQELGIFLPLLFIFLLGAYLWTKKNRKPS